MGVKNPIDSPLLSSPPQNQLVMRSFRWSSCFAFYAIGRKPLIYEIIIFSTITGPPIHNETRVSECLIYDLD